MTSRKKTPPSGGDHPRQEIIIKAIMEAVDQAILAVDSEGRILYFNQHFLDIWHIPREKAEKALDIELRKHVLNQVENPKNFKDTIEMLYDSTDIHHDEIYLKGGRVFERETSPIYNGPEIMGRLWMFRDISDKRKLEKNLKESQTTIEHILTAAPLGIAMAKNRRFLWCNPHMSELTGYSEDELKNQSTEKLYPGPEEFKYVEEHLYPRLKTEKSVLVETKIQKKDGAILDARIHATSMAEDNDEKDIVFILHDITAEKKALRDATLNMERLIRAQKVARIGSIEMDIEKNSIWGSPMARYLFDENDETGYISLDKAIRRIHNEDVEFLTKSLDKLRKGELADYETDFRIHHIGENRELHIHMIAEISRDPESSRNKIVGTLQDISLQKKAEDDLLAKNNQLLKLYIDLQRSEDQLKRAQGVARIGSWEFRTGTGTFKGTEETEKIFGFDNDSHGPGIETIFNFIIPGDRERARTEFYSFLNGENRIYNSIYTILNPVTERHIVINSIAEKETDKNGSIKLITGTVQDITEITEAQKEINAKNIELQELNRELEATIRELEGTNEEFEAQNEALLAAQMRIEESERQYRSIVQDQTELIVRCDTDGMILFANRAFSDYFNLEQDHVTGMPFSPEIFQDDFQEVISTFSTLSAENPVKKLENRIVLPDKTIRWIQWTLRGFFAEDGTPLTFQFVGRDNTEQKKVEEELNRIATVIEQASEDILITDTDGIINYVNPSFEKTTGYKKEEAIGKNPRFLQSGRHPRQFYKEMWLTITSGMVWNGQIINRSKNGELIVQEATISPIKNTDGLITGYAGIRRDITDKIRIENQLLQVQKMEAIGTLAGGLAHDFNNILGGILGSSDMLKMILEKENLAEPGKTNKYLSTIQEAGKRAADMIKQLLTLSRRQESELDTIDLNNAVAHVMEICRNSLPKSVHITEDLLPDQCLVYADSTQIEQVLLNLCVNASHAMTIMRKNEESDPGGTLHVQVEKYISDSDFCRIHPGCVEDTLFYTIRVSDNGVGINESVRERIFDPFFTTKSKEFGTGLGLSMAFNIIQKHDGFLDVESTPGKGSTFTVFLPKSPYSNEKTPDSSDEKNLIHGSGIILVIDDEEVVRTIAEGLLTEAGYRVILADSGMKGVELFRENIDSINAVILDLSMPVMSGIDTYREIKKTAPDTRVVLASGFKHDERVSRLLQMGVRAFIQKPFSGHELTSVLKKILKESS